MLLVICTVEVPTQIIISMEIKIYIDSTGDRTIKSNPPVIMIPCELMTPHKETYPHGLMQAKQLIGRRDPWYAFSVDSGLARTFY